MNNKKNLIPKLKTDQDAAAFFDSHDSTEFINETVVANMSFPHPAHKILISLNENEWRLLRHKASIRKIPYTRLLEKIVHAQLVTT